MFKCLREDLEILGKVPTDKERKLGKPWSDLEQEFVVADYLELLREVLQGRRVNKTATRRQLAQNLANRSESAIEYKRGNISAALHDLGQPSIPGYAPRRNYQRSLSDAILAYLNDHPEIVTLIERSVEAPAMIPSVDDILARIVDAPVRSLDVEKLADARRVALRVPKLINYLECEARNRSLGKAGEKFVLGFEHERLSRAGKVRLAEKIEHIADTRGDGAGYDIHSFEVDGRDRLIEVKTTAYGIETPFFVSSNELSFSRESSSNYVLYRAFEFRESPKLFTLSGALDQSVVLRPVNFMARR